MSKNVRCIAEFRNIFCSGKERLQFQEPFVIIQRRIQTTSKGIRRVSAFCRPLCTVAPQSIFNTTTSTARSVAESILSSRTAQHRDETPLYVSDSSAFEVFPLVVWPYASSCAVAVRRLDIGIYRTRYTRVLRHM